MSGDECVDVRRRCGDEIFVLDVVRDFSERVGVGKCDIGWWCWVRGVLGDVWCVGGDVLDVWSVSECGERRGDGDFVCEKVGIRGGGVLLEWGDVCVCGVISVMGDGDGGEEIE